MALQETGVRLVAQDAAQFVRDMNRGSDAVTDFGRDTKQASIGARALGSALGNIAADVTRRIADGFIQAGRAATGFMADSVMMAADLEAQMDAVGAVMGASNEEIEQLRGLVMELGVDPNLKVSSVEAAEAIEMLARNGLSMTEIMEGAAQGTVFLANATGADFSLAADIATDAMALFNVEANDMLRVVDGAASVANNSKFTMQDYALAIRNGGAMAAQAGVSLEDFNTVIAVSAEELGTGMRAGTGFRNFLTRLTPSTKTATGAMMELGLITEEGTNILLTAEGGYKSMAEVSQILNDKLAGLSEAQRDAALEVIFGQDAMGTAIALMNEGAVVYDTTAEAAEGLGLSQAALSAAVAELGINVDDGINKFEAMSIQMAQMDSAESAATRVDNLAGAMDILSGVIEAVRIEIGTAMIPAVTEFTRLFSDFIEQNSGQIIEWFQNFGDTLLSFAEGFISAFGNDAGPLNAFVEGLKNAGIPAETIDSITKFGTAAINIGTFLIDHGPDIVRQAGTVLAALGAFRIVSGIASAVTALTTAWTAVTAVIAASGSTFAGIVALLGGPVTLTIAAVVAAATGLYIAWKNNFLGIQDITKAAIDKVREWIGEGLERIKAWWAEHGDSVMVIVNSFMEFVRGQFEMNMNQITAVVEFAVETLTTIWEATRDTYQQTTEEWWAAVSQIFESMGDILGGIVDGIAALIEGDWDAFGLSILAITEGFWGLISGIFESHIAILSGVTQSIIDAISALWGDYDWVQIGIDVYTGIVDGLKAGIGAVAAAAGELATAAWDRLTSFYETQSPSKLMIRLFEDDIAGGAVIGLLNAEGKISETFEKVFGFTDAIGGLGNTAMNMLKEDLITPLEGMAGNQDVVIDQQIKKLIDGMQQEQQWWTVDLDHIEKRREKAAVQLRDIIDGFDVILDDTKRENRIKELTMEIQEMDSALFELRQLDGQRFTDDMFERFSANQLQEMVYGGFFQGLEPGSELFTTFNNILSMMSQREAAAERIAEQEERILKLQEKQKELGFLQQQLDLLSFMKENSLDISLLGGISLGTGADPGAIVDATIEAYTAAISNIAPALNPAAVNSLLGPSDRGGTTNNVTINGTYNEQTPETVASEVTLALSGY